MKEKAEWPLELKRTKQREEIYRILENAEKPLSANEIYAQIDKTLCQKYQFAISTVYRILLAFEENHLVTKATLIGDETALYEMKRGGHKHYAICLKCHKLVPLEKCPFEKVQIQTKDSDFTITSHKIEIYGYCKTCQNNLQKQGEDT